MSSLKIACIGQNVEAPIAAEHQHFKHFMAYLHADFPCDCFFINHNDAKQVTDQLLAIRQHEDYFLSPVFVAHDTLPLYGELQDGVGDDWEKIQHTAEHIEQKVSALPAMVDKQDSEQRLLRFLYSREKRQLNPTLDQRSSGVVRYGTAEAFFHDGAEPWLRLRALAKRNILAKVVLRDELQSCEHCDSSLLNFKRCCPNCQSIDTEANKFIHCFSCGHNGCERDFLKQDLLVCPRCSKKLRHIGLDYDRPLEQVKCNQCQHNFVEHQTLASCLQCHQTMRPEELVTKKIYVYQLAEKGHQWVKKQYNSYLQPMKDAFNFVESDHFKFSLHWLMKLCHRHQDMHFSLFALRGTNQKNLWEAVGSNKFHELLDKYFHLMRCQLRITDMSTRFKDDTALFLLPQTSFADTQTVAYKLQNYIDEGHHGIDKQLFFKYDYISTKNLNLKDYDDSLMIGELLARLSDD